MIGPLSAQNVNVTYGQQTRGDTASLNYGCNPANRTYLSSEPIEIPQRFYNTSQNQLSVTVFTIFQLENCVHHVIRSLGRVRGRSCTNRKSVIDSPIHLAQRKVLLHLSPFRRTSNSKLRPPELAASYWGVRLTWRVENSINQNLAHTFLLDLHTYQIPILHSLGAMHILNRRTDRRSPSS